MNLITIPALFDRIRKNIKLAGLALAVTFVVSACSQGNSTVTTGQESGGGVVLPTALVTLPPGGKLAAYIRIDGGERHTMTINGDTATVSLNGITEGDHIFTVEFEYSYVNPGNSVSSDPIILASADKTINIAPGNNTLDILETDYDIDGYDEDGDGVPNLNEISNGTSPFARIAVTQIDNNTSEDGVTATFNVVLTSLPSDDVTVTINSSDVSEGTVDQTSITFTPENWLDPQTITVTGINDDIADGDIAYTIELAAAASNDSDYNGYDPDDVAVTNTDNDTVGITVSTISGNTTESGTSATLTLVLTSVPTSDVSIGVSSSDSSEGLIDQTSLTFGTSNWNVPQTIIVTGVDDDLADGNQPYFIQFTAAVSDDSLYDGVALDDVGVTNVDNDSPGFNVSPINGNTGEDGTSASFTVALTSAPTATVSIGISSSDNTEGVADNASVSLNADNWNIPQTITVTGIDDTVDDGDQNYTIVLAAASSGDSSYDGLNPDDINVINTDNDTAGFVVSPVSDNTTEAGATATFTVALSSTPGADVSIGISSLDTTEGTVDQNSLTFSASNWDVPQTVTVTGVDDDVADGNQVFTIQLAGATSSDNLFSGINPDDVAVTNVDNDSAGFNVSPISGNTSETGSTATFNVALTSAPTADVTIAISSSDTTEGTIDTTSLVFSPDNWGTSQIVTVTGVDDDTDDGDQTYSINLAAATSADTIYAGLDPNDINVLNIDNDSAGFTVSAISGNTSETGTTATFTVSLTSAPIANVTIPVSSSDTSEGSANPLSLTFTAANWNNAQTVTVTGVDDFIADGDQTYSINLEPTTSTDGVYSGLNPADVSVTNIDNDAAGFVVSGISANTTEAGTTATFTVSLTSAPTATVTIPVSSSDTSEGTVNTSLLTFTASNWNAAQTVTVTGVDDFIDDGNQTYTINLAAASSTDTTYAGMNPNNVSVTNIDNDTAGIAVSSVSGNTSEAGATATFTVALTSAPTANVTIGISSSDTSEGTVSTNSLTFTSSNWNNAQTVTIIGVDDSLVDGLQFYSIITAAAESTDANYNGMNTIDITLSNIDNDYSIGGTVSGLSGTGLVLLSNFGGSINIFSNGNFTFSTGLTSGSSYSVSVFSSPTGQVCKIANGSGVVATSNVTDIRVDCSSIIGAIIGGQPEAVAIQGSYAYVAAHAILSVIDISNPANPTQVSYFDIAGQAYGITIVGNIAYVASGSEGLRILDISNPLSIVELGSYNTPNSARRVAIKGDYAYVADANSGLRIINISNPASPYQVGFYDTAGYAQDIAISGNYAFVADTANGLQVIDISSVATPTPVASLTTLTATDGVVLSGNYAYVANGSFGLYVVDISNPLAPTITGSFDTPGNAYRVSVSGNYAYVADNGGGLRVVDVSAPAAPVEVGFYNNGGWAEGVYVDGSIAYIADWYNGFRILDIANPVSPIETGFYDAPGAANSSTVSGNYAYLADSYDGLRVIDVSNPSKPIEVGFFNSPGFSGSVTLNGNVAYLTEGFDGIRIVDITNPAAPFEVGLYNTPNSAHDIDINGTLMYVADTTSGLRILDITDPIAPSEIGFINPNSQYITYGVKVSGSYAYLADSNAALRVVDVSNPGAPIEVGSVALSGTPYNIAISGNYAYVAALNAGLYIIDISAPTSPVVANFYSQTGSANQVTISGNYAYVAAGFSGLHVLDITTPTSPVLAKYFTTPGDPSGVAVSGNYVFLSERNTGFEIYLFNNP